MVADTPARGVQIPSAIITPSQNINGALVVLVGVMALGYIAIAILFARRYTRSPRLTDEDENYMPTTERYADKPSL